jgi:hypothetical protein
MTDNTQPLTPEQVVEMLEAADAANPSPIRQIAEELIRSGEITPETTLADGLALFERHLIVRP